MMHADRTNRSMLLLLALILLAAGGFGAAASFGGFGRSVQGDKLKTNRVWTFFGAHGDWLWPLVALVALLMAVAALRWLRVLLFSTDRVGDLPIASVRGTGRSSLIPAALTDAVTEEIRSYRGIHGARARLVGDADDPRLVVVATVEDSADLIATRHQIETGALARARQALDKPDLPIQLDLAVTTKRTTRVS
jgi:hypothetical protein